MFWKGFRGAYSESAAEKAYPNCEAVPCEQFDTAFEVGYKIFFSAVLNYSYSYIFLMELVVSGDAFDFI